MIIMVLILFCVFLLAMILHVRSRLLRHQRISQLSNLRRELINLLHKEIIDVDSELFKYVYRSLEVLIRIHFFNLRDRLLTSKQAIEIILQKDEYSQKRNMIIKELAKAMAGKNRKEVEQFFSKYSLTIFKTIFKNRFIFLLHVSSILIIFVIRLMHLKSLRWLLTLQLAINDMMNLKRKLGNHTSQWPAAA